MIPCLKINRILLLMVGLWPYEQSKLVQFQSILFFGFIISRTVFQLTTLITTRWTLKFLINLSSVTSFNFVFLITYGIFYINNKYIKYLLEQFQRTYNEIKDQNELFILEKYNDIAKRYTNALIDIATKILYKMQYFGTIKTINIHINFYLICLMLVVGVCIECFALYHTFLPIILDIILPKNESRSNSPILSITEYFIDQRKYFYLIVLHVSVATVVGITELVATGTMIVICFQHAYGMFRIASYRIEQAIIIDTLKNTVLENGNFAYNSIIYAVDMHRKATKYVREILSLCEMAYIIIIAISIVTASVNLYQIFQKVPSGDDEGYLLPFTFLCGSYICIFLVNYISQEIAHHNNHIHISAYNVQWYMAPLHVQKLLLFLLQNSSKKLNISLSGFFVGSLESFSKMVSISISYFIVLSSTTK